jgi:hypothetical protein
VDAKLEGSVWLAQGQVLITDFRDYCRVLPIARRLDPKARVRAVAEAEVPEGAELIAGVP